MKKRLIIVTIIILIFNIVGGIIYMRRNKNTNMADQQMISICKKIELSLENNVLVGEFIDNSNIDAIETNENVPINEEIANTTSKNNVNKTQQSNTKTKNNNETNKTSKATIDSNSSIQTNTTSQNSSSKINLSKYSYYEKGSDGSYKGFIENQTEINKLKNLINTTINDFGYKNIKITLDSSLAKDGTRYFTANKTNVANLVNDSEGFNIHYYAIQEYFISPDGTETYFQTRSYIKIK